MKEAIYILEKNGEVFYVGKAIKPDVRLGQHQRVYGKDITMKVIDYIPSDLVSKVERYYIGYYKSKGCKLVNKQKVDLVNWKKNGQWRSMDFKYEVGLNLKDRYTAKGKDWKVAVESFSNVVNAYNRLKDELDRHLTIVRQDIDKDYNVELNLK